MLRLPKFVTRSLSVRLSLMVVGAIALLLWAALTVMFKYSRQAVKQEALQNASQTLEGTVQRIDNIMLNVEQATGNMFFNLMPQLDNPDMVFTCCRKLVESNRYISGCAVALEPYYYPGREFFMAYVHRAAGGSLAAADSAIIESETFGDRPYTEQVWYTTPMTTGAAGWLNPLEGMDIDTEPIATFCLPIMGSDGKPRGVIGVDVSLNRLSHIVMEAKPSPNSYCTLLTKDGSYIVHPDSSKLLDESVFTQTLRGADPSVKEAAEAMVAGGSGYRPFLLDGVRYYVFYKPFNRTMVPGRAEGNLGWSAGIIYPEDDIFGEYNRLLYFVLAIAVLGLLLLFATCRAITHRQLKPLLLLTRSAQRIADGNYSETIPDAQRQDEIGLLEENFQQMQQSLAANISELEQMKETLGERGKVLSEAYRQAKEADRVKTSFLHNMTNQMLAPATAIMEDVGALCDFSRDIPKEESGRLTDDIQTQAKFITDLLNGVLDVSQEKAGADNKVSLTNSVIS